jgi:hypothetical protein
LAGAPASGMARTPDGPVLMFEPPLRALIAGLKADRLT